MIRRPPRSTLFPTRRSSDLSVGASLSRERRPGGHGDPADAQDHCHRRFVQHGEDRKSTRLNSSHANISYAVFCLKKKKKTKKTTEDNTTTQKYQTSQ